MTTVSENAMALWMWPLNSLSLLNDMSETVSSAHSVVVARLPTIADAMRQPWTADHVELSKMVSEKTSAFAVSGRAVTAAGETLLLAAEANMAVMGRLFSGAALWPSDWMRIAEQNLAATAAVVTLPALALAPIHRTVVGNDKRLRNRSAALQTP
ncbi:hypothetical protein Q4F19_06920 [Sphingomonas sp. BIUV-7]|uniref:Uncharacterized protein n=1 Tax=Sphingomonas natans TaxID=3063330 RepID=A0ABT8Y721_9SPHN|nr:hypothetical protein [Sphingomonas sp. BIUV-7]MDO6414107.1 hypothetical protein [Sphingomonas sp. BIUV-7]